VVFGDKCIILIMLFRLVRSVSADAEEICELSPSYSGN
jgi:hypothetical protein